MYNEIDMRIRLSEDQIKFLKKADKIVIGILLLTGSILLWDGYDMYRGGHLTNLCLIAIGIMIGNIVWFLGELFRSNFEISSEKNSIEHFKKMQREEIYVRALQSMKGAEMQMKGISDSYQELIRNTNESCRESKQQV